MSVLGRDEFRKAVFTRDGGKCVFCDLTAVDAHHIIERRLFPDGGYYLDNGVAVCATHHLECEMTTVDVDTVRAAAGITRIIVPPHLYHDQPYDKWGNPVLPNGQRCKGELFYDTSVQKILNAGGVLSLFTDKVKYPRTHHLPWSPGMNEDDRVMITMDKLQAGRIVVTEKMDGENTTLYRDYYHARSVTSRSHESQNWVKNFWSSFKHDIPDGWRICGENLFARHSIPYNALDSFFLGFAIWTDTNKCLRWSETLEWFEMLGITPVPTLFRGEYYDWTKKYMASPLTSEGYVMRIEGEFPYSDFRNCVGKYVRKDHVQTVQHWKYGQPVVPNRMA